MKVDINSFLRGYEQGLKEAWEEIVKIATKGYTPRELQIFARTKIATLRDLIAMKQRELERKFRPEEEEEQEIVRAPQPSQFLAEVSEGNAYLVLEPRPDKSFELFNRICRRGIAGLCFVRTPPSTIIEQYKERLGSAKLFWLSKEPQKGESYYTAIFPDLTTIQNTIQDYTERAGQSVILLDGLDYLISSTSFDRVLKFINSLVDFIFPHRSYLLIPFVQGILGEKEFKQLEKAVSSVIR